MPKRTARNSMPRLVRISPLMRKGGFHVLTGVPDGGMLRMRAEALRRLPTADKVGVSTNGIRRRMLQAVGGKAQFTFYHGRRMRARLRKLTGTAVVPAGRIGHYLYYIRPGDHIGTHRDDATNHDLVLITCVVDTPDSSAPGGTFCVYPDRLTEHTAAVRATPRRGAVEFRLRPGQSLALFGRWIPHAVRPIGRGQKRIVSVLCYKLAGTRYGRPGRHPASPD